MADKQLEYGSELARIERLIADLQEQPGEHTALMRERLESARFYLTGSMPEEYDFELNLARQVLPDVESQDSKQKVEEFLKQKRPAA